jgi:ankyrin repeat protein
MLKPNKEKLQALLKEYSQLPVYFGIEVKDVNTRASLGDYPIHFAAWGGKIEEVEIFLEFGADVNALGDRGFTPLHSAAGKGHLEVVEFLLERGADPSIKNDEGDTPLELARFSDKEEAEIKLLEIEKDVEISMD